jgi:hypothetical protein
VLRQACCRALKTLDPAPGGGGQVQPGSPAYLAQTGTRASRLVSPGQDAPSGAPGHMWCLTRPAPPVILDNELIECGIRPYQQIEDGTQVRLCPFLIGKPGYFYFVVPRCLAMLLVIPAEIVEEEPSTRPEEPMVLP